MIVLDGGITVQTVRNDLWNIINKSAGEGKSNQMKLFYRRKV